MIFSGGRTDRLLQDDGSLKHRLQWLLICRLALAVFFLLLTIGVQSRRTEDLLSAQLQPLYYFSCILFAFTIVGAWSLGRIQRLRRFAYMQLFFDVAAVTTLIFLSGGIDSPFTFLYMPVIISAALLLYRRGSMLVASACSVSYGLLLDLQYFAWISPLQIVSQAVPPRESGTYLTSILMSIAGFYLVAYLSGYLAEEVQKSSREVREQKRDFHQLEMLHLNIVQSMKSGLLTVGPDERIVSSNVSARRILELSPEKVHDRPLREIFPELGTPSLLESKETNSANGVQEPERRSIQYRSPSGDVLYLGYNVSVLHTTEGMRTGWVVIFQDLTHLKAMEERVQRMERLAFAGKMAAEIAHEIKNPLAAISGAVQMLQVETRQDTLHAKLMEIVYREIDRINELVTDFLWMAKVTRKPGSLEPVAICGIIQEVLALLKTRNKVGSGHSLGTVFSANPTCSLDPHHLRQVLWNLLVNALEAMPQGGNIRILVSLAEAPSGDGQEAVIEVRDEGPGIPEDVRGRIFEPFFTTKPTGTGLGLSIVYQLIENAGGRVEVCRHPEGGTSFSVFFPTTPLFPLGN
ncbi:MAG: ATP-binding protein [Syntrophobacteraceae bacterium]|nr:PAS domain S-box protein [Desulfobacteraceae bacterium]